MQSDGFGGIVIILVALAVALIPLAGMWKIFEKAGKPGWAAIIPIYNTWVLVKVAGKEWYWFVALLIPVVNFIAVIVIMLGISRNFGQGVGFALGLIFLSIIFIPLLGFGNYQYRGGRGGQAPR